MNKTIIAPIIAVLALVSQQVFHVELNDSVQSDIVNALLTAVTLYGIFKNHKKV
jgi:uncharacterized membrane protein YfbV (UPF0208 family)